jgi:hypothetical protein
LEGVRTVVSAAELKIGPSQDFRCPLLTSLRGGVQVTSTSCKLYVCASPRSDNALILHTTHVQGFYLISWNFQLLPQHQQDQLGRLPATPPPQDVGFCILAKKPDGSFPQLQSYRSVHYPVLLPLILLLLPCLWVSSM